MDNDLGKGPKNGLPHTTKSATERGREIKDDAQKLYSDARGAASELARTIDLKGRIDRNPLAMVAAGFGIGFVLGGGLFSRSAGRLLGWGLRLAVMPYLKYELLGRAADLVRGGVEQGLAGEGVPASERGY